MLQIIGAIQLRKEIDDEWMLILSGALSVLFGLALVIAPGAGAVALIWAIAFYAILFAVCNAPLPSGYGSSDHNGMGEEYR